MYITYILHFYDILYLFKERLNAIGLTWNQVRPPAKTWDERLDILKQYKETHGTWPNRHEKWNGVGEWIHNQRRYYKQKDKKFMADRAPKLDEIGFPWVMQSYTNLSWEDSFQKLVEFGRVNRHFDVPPPEGSGAGVEEATRFYRSVTLVSDNRVNVTFPFISFEVYILTKISFAIFIFV